MTRVILASGNAGKVREIGTLLAEQGLELVAQNSLGVPVAEETGTTFAENAILKARNACAYTGAPAIADDSGLAVDALDGAPGVYSARWAGDTAANNARLAAALEQVSEHRRAARFYCVLVYMRYAADPAPAIATGTWPGEVIPIPRGTGGFGYDPHFWIAEHQCTAAELSEAEKNRISHRARALRALKAALGD